MPFGDRVVVVIREWGKAAYVFTKRTGDHFEFDTELKPKSPYYPMPEREVMGRTIYSKNPKFNEWVEDWKKINKVDQTEGNLAILAQCPICIIRLELLAGLAPGPIHNNDAHNVDDVGGEDVKNLTVENLISFLCIQIGTYFLHFAKLTIGRLNKW